MRFPTVRGNNQPQGRQGFSDPKVQFSAKQCVKLDALITRMLCCTSYPVDKAYEKFKLSSDASGGLWKPAALRFQYLGHS
jgi:hypothetical protein